MKIKNIKIKSPQKDIIRDIDFSLEGISFIYGDIKSPLNPKATINSLGKTLLIKCIDYLYGANEDLNIIKEDIHGYIVDATLIHKGNAYNVVRVLGTTEGMLIDNKPYTLTEYKCFFSISRDKVSRQLLVNKKNHVISRRTNPNKDDVLCYLYLLGLTDITEKIESIYDAQNKIKSLKENKKELISFYGSFDAKQIDEEIYFIDKEIARLTKELEVITQKIRRIEVSNLQENVVEEYSTKSELMKLKKAEYQKSKIEAQRLVDFIDSSNKIDVTSEHILAIYNKTKLEVPEYVKKEIQEVEAFHKIVYNERKGFLTVKLETIEKAKDKLGKEVRELSSQIDRLGQVISVNEVYQESIELYGKFNNDLQELKYREGKLSQVKEIDENIENQDSILATNFELSATILKKYDDLISKYRDFVYSITKSIYDEEVNSYFDIVIRKKNQRTRPASIDISLKGDTGEGVNEVKKNLIDYLLFEYNTSLDYLIQDSSCYNGIDPRQVSSMIKEVARIADETNKQAIVAVNKYQIGEYSDVVSYVEENSSISLSEENKLFKFNFG